MARPVVAACLAGRLAALAITVAACGGPVRGQEAFCQRLQRDRDLLVTGVVDVKTADDAASRYAALDGLAPEIIRADWHQVTLLVQTAAKTDPSSTDARSALVQQAYATAPAAAAVTQYAKTTCGVDMAAPVTTPAPASSITTAAAPPAPETTAPPASPPSSA